MGRRQPGPFGMGYYHDPFDPFISWWTLDCDEPCSGGRSPWPLGVQPVRPPPNDIRFLVDYIVAEMNTNAHSAFVKYLAELNGFSATECIEDLSKLPLQELLLSFGITPSLCVTKKIGIYIPD